MRAEPCADPAGAAFVYAPQGSAAFNRRLDACLAELAQDVTDACGPDLVGLVLGGGYGRGEGGVWSVDGVECAYNDLDLVIVQTSHRVNPRLEAIGARYHARLGIDVDFSRPLTPADIAGWEHRLMWHDLAAGHRVLAGPPDLIQRLAPAWGPAPLPLVEAARLLLNRGAGLVWAARVQRGTVPAPDRDFLRRNVQKAVLALGDALLIAAGAYRTPGVAKLDALRQLASTGAVPAHPRLLDLYRRALEFKLRPDAPRRAPVPDASWAETAQLWGRTFRWVEERRLARPFADLDAYASWRGAREPPEHTWARLPRNLWVNARCGRLSLFYPREHLYRSIPRTLGLTRADRATDAEAGAFLELWKHCN